MSNYILIGAATSCAFLTLSLRLIPSLSGLSLIALVLAFVLNYYDYVEGGTEGFNGLRRSGKVGHHEELNDWPWPFQV
ncbi:hypothetical protein QJS04_geneDACA015560 [Acorus gramineus]|uniref:Uncharacterized protein n=1 Tax=Acorus gramineus TaxID=55184 RepID=A0AAV9AQT5_ACOGR|nr:hypothetical protein QJS04_geneDACA015560 [Acorus gramineus]